MKEKSKGRKIIILTIGMVIMITAVAILLVSSIKEYANSVVDHQKEQLSTIVNAASDAVESYIDNCIMDINTFVETREFYEGEAQYLETGENKYLNFMSNAHMRSHYPVVSDIEIYGTKGEYIINLREREYRLINLVSEQEDMRIRIFQDQDDKMYLAVSKINENGLEVRIYLDCENMFETLMSRVKLGEKGYIMVKDANGIIIMHDVKEQIGMDVIRDRKKRYPDVDLNELEQMVRHQLAGETGTAIYHSYWWADAKNGLQRVKKISAYAPAKLGDAFISLSAVMDYSEVSRPMVWGISKMAGIAALLMLASVSCIAIFYYMVQSQRAYAKENQYLKEINQRLEELHKSEEYINHQQRLQMIGTMTGGIAHEFNNFLTPIMGYAGLMMNELPEDSEYHEEAVEIYESAEKAKEIIQQISALSKKNTDTVYQYLPLKPLLSRAVKTVESVCPYNIEIITQLDVDGGIFGNKTQINQVVLNICVNAFHAIGKEQGIVRISCEESEYIEDGQKLVRLEIEDNGCGMDEITQEQMFTPFFTTKESGQGVGLGLAMVQNIIEAHHGKIKVYSREGEGTRFIIYLPLGKEPEVHLERQKETREKKVYRVILVFDNLKILKLLEKGLKKEGIETVTATNQAEALRVLQEKRFDVAVMDSELLKKSSVDLAFQMKSLQNDLYIILMTGLLREEITNAKESGIIDSVMQKPVVLSDLLLELDKCGKR